MHDRDDNESTPMGYTPMASLPPMGGERGMRGMRGMRGSGMRGMRGMGDMGGMRAMRGVGLGRGMRGGRGGAMMDDDMPHQQPQSRPPPRRGEFEDHHDHDDRNFTDAP